MKKFLATSVLGLLAAGAMAQGTVNFANNGNQPAPNNTTPLGRVYTDAAHTVLADNTIDVQLYEGSTALGVPIAVKSFNGAGTGVFTGGAAGQFTLTDVAAGGTATLTVKAWAIASGASYQAAVAGNGTFGDSGSFAYVTGGGGTPPAPPTTLLGMPSFNVAPHSVPEPTTLALGALGLGALLIRRRK